MKEEIEGVLQLKEACAKMILTALPSFKITTNNKTYPLS